MLQLVRNFLLLPNYERQEKTCDCLPWRDS